MEPPPKAADLIRRLEEELLQLETRRSAKQVSDLLADEFIEFGSSGRIFDRAKIIESLQQEQQVQSVQRSITDFSATWLAPDTVLVTYRLVVRDDASEQVGRTLRSSIWKSTNNRWRMVFHQGTPETKR
jgi:hypothetical protein